MGCVRAAHFPLGPQYAMRCMVCTVCLVQAGTRARTHRPLRPLAEGRTTIYHQPDQAIHPLDALSTFVGGFPVTTPHQLGLHCTELARRVAS